MAAKNLDRKEVLFFIMAIKALRGPELKTSCCDRTNRSVTQWDKVCLVLVCLCVCVCVWRQHVEPQVWQHANSSQERDSSNSLVAFRRSKLLRTKIEDEVTMLSCLPRAFGKHWVSERRSRRSGHTELFFTFPNDDLMPKSNLCLCTIVFKFGHPKNETRVWF